MNIKYVIAFLLVSAIPGPAWSGACNNTTFRQFYDGIAHQSNGDPNYIRFDKTPNNYNGFNEYCLATANNPQCFDLYGNRYKLVATSAPTTRWSAAVCGKARQSNNWYNYEHRVFLTDGSIINYFPRLWFQYQDNSGNWHTLTDSNTGNLASGTFNANTVQSYRWKWFSSTPRKFRIVIDQAMKFDEFDLIMDW